MNSRMTVACFLAGALALPLTGFAADAENVGSSVKVYVDDSVITTKVKANLADERAMSLIHISVDTDRNGVVFLGGTAPSQRAIERAVSIAHGVAGVVAVRSTISIKDE